MLRAKTKPLCIKDYVPVLGFFDLRCFNLNAKEFRSAWSVQLHLRFVEDHKAYYKSMCPNEWEKNKNLSAELQHFLWPRLKVDVELN